MAERIIGYVDVKKGPHEALLVATDERFIVCWTWRHGFLLRLLVPWFVRLILPIRKAGKLEKLSPDEALNDHDHNFAIPFSDVVEVRTGGLLAKNMVIASRETEYRFRLKKTQLYHFEDHVRPYLTDKVSIR